MRASTLRSCTILLVALVLPNARAHAQTPPPPLWDIQVGASFVDTGGNSDTSSAGSDLEIHRRGEVWRLESEATAVRASTNGVKTAERYLGQFRGARDVSKLFGITSGVKVERDTFSGISVRSILDGGLSWRLVRGNRWTLDGVTALAWDHERPTPGADGDHVRNDAAGVLQLLSRIPFGESGDFTQRYTLYPDLSDTSATRSETEAAVEASMNAHLALKFGYLLRYSHVPVPGFKKTDSTTTASVVLRWKATTPAAK